MNLAVNYLEKDDDWLAQSVVRKADSRHFIPLYYASFDTENPSRILNYLYIFCVFIFYQQLKSIPFAIVPTLLLYFVCSPNNKNNKELAGAEIHTYPTFFVESLTCFFVLVMHCVNCFFQFHVFWKNENFFAIFALWQIKATNLLQYTVLSM